jgi:protein TonB
MNASREAPARRRWLESLRWGACFALALCFHAGATAALIARWNDSSDLVANAPVVMIDLAPVPVAPDTTPTEAPPDQVESKQQIEPDPQPEKPVEKAELTPDPPPAPEKPVEKLDLPPIPQAEVTLPVTPPKPLPKPKPKRKASLASAPSTAEQKADRAAAPAAGAASRDPSALPNWKSELVARLERYKRYPSDARGENGVAQLAFSIDRSGGVHNARIIRSSGSSALDRETLALAQRAAPLPPPPPEVSGTQIAIVVPIRFNVR